MFSTIKTTMIKSAILVLLDHKRLYIELPVRKMQLFSHLHILCYIVSFLGGKKQAFINCSVSGNRKPGNSS